MFVVSKTNYLKIVKASAWYDLVVTAAFATPWTFTFFYHAIQSLAANLGLPGITPPLSVIDILFANLLGTVVIIWSLVRLHKSEVVLGRYDAIGRLFFVIWQIYAVCTGGSVILLGFTFFEFIFGVLQALRLKPDEGV